MIDYGNLAARLAERKDRWSLLAEYVRDWRLPVAGKTLYAPMDIAEAEDRLGFALPLALREWYLLPSQPYQLTANHVTCHHLLGPSELQEVAGRVVFQLENQDCCEWAFRVAEARLDDPPVYIGYPDERGEGGEWVWEQLQNQTFSEFALQLVLRETVNACGYDAYAEGLAPAALAQLERAFQPLGLPVWLEMGAGLRFFGGLDVIAAGVGDCHRAGEAVVFVGARSRAGLQLALSKLELEWTAVNDSGCASGANTRWRESDVA